MNNPYGRCPACRGVGTLEVFVKTWDGRPYGRRPDIKCETCDGVGLFETAADAACRYQNQKQT